jgi:hypothetical protein
LDYQRLFTVSKPTASRDLEQLLSLGVLAKLGTTGKGTYYVLNLKRLTKGSKGSKGSSTQVPCQANAPSKARKRKGT